MPQRLKPPTTESSDLRNAGLKVTLPRLKILDILAEGSDRHMSAEDIYKRLLVANQDIGLAGFIRGDNSSIPNQCVHGFSVPSLRLSALT